MDMVSDFATKAIFTIHWPCDLDLNLDPFANLYTDNFDKVAKLREN